MLKPSFEEFCQLCDRGNLVPVYDEQLADLETPVSVLSRFADRDRVFLLESVAGGGERFGRYSFIGLEPYAVFTIEEGKPYLERNGEKRELPAPDGAFFALRAELRNLRCAAPEGLPPLFGGAIGYLGYETVNQFETLPEPKRPLSGPSAAFLLTDEMVIFDNLRHTVLLVVNVRPGEFADRRAAYEQATRQIRSLNQTLRQPRAAAPMPVAAPQPPPRLRSNLDREAFAAMVEKAKAHIVAGDIIQIVLSQRFFCPNTLDSVELYRALRLINPSPYTFFFKNGDRLLVGASPETLVKLDHGRATVRPIAGTRKRGATPADDLALADELLRDEKERAEHLMLLDLGRNDLGRIAVPGSVQVREFMQVERYSHVMHLTSDVECVMGSGQDGFDLVKAVFPAGTLSGAPKVRAMELIHALEPEPRGIYGGAVGYFSYTGNLDLAITIRTLTIENGEISVQAGAGIVYDSDPEREYEETVNKARAVFQAIQLAANHLEL